MVHDGEAHLLLGDSCRGSRGRVFHFDEIVAQLGGGRRRRRRSVTALMAVVLASVRLAAGWGAWLLHHHQMLAASDVRLELEAVGGLMPADVALVRVTEAVASGVDGEHHVIEEDHSTVHAVIGLQLFDVSFRFRR